MSKENNIYLYMYSASCEIDQNIAVKSSYKSHMGLVLKRETRYTNTSLTCCDDVWLWDSK